MSTRGARLAHDGRRALSTALAGWLCVAGAPLGAAGPAAGVPGRAQVPTASSEGGQPEAAQVGPVLLNVGAITTAAPRVQALRAPAGSFEGKRLHLVQFGGPIRPEWYAQLQATGVRVVQYIPHFAYLVYGDAPGLGRLQRMAESPSAVRWDGPYLDSYKVQPAARAETRARLGLPADRDEFSVQLVADAEANAETLRVVEGLAAAPVRRQWQILQYRNLVVSLPVDAVDEVAARPDVVSIDRYATPVLFDERQDRIVTGQLTLDGPSAGDHLAYLAAKGFTQAQFDASAFVVDVSDSGIDNGTTQPNHFGLRGGGSPSGASRVRYSRLEGTPNPGSTLQGCDGHGNLNAHIVAGYVPDPATLPDPGVHADPSGFRYGLGVCPFVKVGSSVVFDPGSYTFPDLPNLQARAYADDARISTNSWGAAGGAYTVDSQTFDALVRDAQPATSVFPTAGNQEMVVVFSAGNSGPAANTIGAPGTAKNVIAVGASEGVQAFGGADGCGYGDAAADRANDMASFSGRGPTDDGRVKPEIVAAGTHVSGGVFQAAASVAGTGAAGACFDGSKVCGGVGSRFFPAGQEFYTASSGTSHSAPAVAGGAALLRQHFINNGLTPPSPAMTKALLVNSARHLTGAGAGDTLPSNTQGMGLMNLDTSFAQLAGPRVLHDQRVGDRFTATGQQRVVTGVVASSGEPFRVSLAWTDAPGATSGASYVNNLDLEVTVGGALYRGNVFTGATSTTGGTADPRNNLESVFLPAGVSGPFVVRVVAANIAGDGVPGVGGPLDQDYALVVSNATADATPRPVLVAGASTVVADSCSGDGSLDPGEAATVSFCLGNVGGADTSAAVGTLQAAGGVTLPSAPQAYGVLAAGGAAVCRSFDLVVGSLPCGASLTATIQVQDGPADLGSVTWLLPTGAPAVALAESFDGVAPPSLPPGWSSVSEAGPESWATVGTSPDTPPNAAYVNDPGTLSLTSLLSPPIAVPATSRPIVLTFRHWFDLDAGWDGGVLELKVGAGAFQDLLAAGGSFASGGYTHTLGSGSALAGRQAWSGNSAGYLAVTANLPQSASGQTVQIRWRRGTDTAVSRTGWRVDTVRLMAGTACCTPSLPTLSIDDVAVAEGDAGTTTLGFTVSLSAASGQAVTVGYATADGTATTADGDYLAASGTLTFAPGVTTRPVSVAVNGDTRPEADETLAVGLTNPVGASVFDAQGLGTIRNDDVAMQTLTVVRAGLGSGEVSSTPPGIACGLDCTQDFAEGTTVRLTAAPSPGSALVGWSAGCTVTEAGCDVTMDGPKTVTALFDLVGEPITWERLIQTEVVGTALRRPAGTGWNAGAVSSKVIVSGDGYVEYTVPSSPGQAMFGLSHGDTDGTDADIDFALATGPAAGQLSVFEKGVGRGTVGTCAGGDRLRVAVEGGVVTYRRNGELLGTSAASPTYPLLADTSLYSAGTELLDGRIAGQLDVRVDPQGTEVYWRNAVRATATGATLFRDEGQGWNAGASSSQELVRGDGHAEYRVADLTSSVAFGLSHGDADQGYADVDYALFTDAGTGQVMAFEGGVYRATLGAYKVGDLVRVAVEGGVVTYALNGTTLYTSSTPPTYPLVTDTSLYSAGARVQDARMAGELKEIVTWTHRNGVAVVDDALTRRWLARGAAGAISSRRITGPDGGAEYRVSRAGRVMFGLSHGDDGSGFADIDFALCTFPPGGSLMVFERGAYRGTLGTYSEGDVLAVTVDAGGVAYRKNGALLGRSSVAPVYPLVIDVSLFSGRIEGARLFGRVSSVPEDAVAWSNLVNVTDSGGTLRRPTGQGWDAGAASLQTLAADGYAEYTVSSVADTVMFGLGNGDSGPGYADIEYGILTCPQTSRLFVVEGGVLRSRARGYAAGDTLRVSVEGGLVKYRRNGNLLYISEVTPSFPLNVDTSLYSPGATVAGGKVGREE